MENMDAMLEKIIEMDSNARLREGETEQYREKALNELAENKKQLLLLESQRVEDTVGKYAERLKTELNKQIAALESDEKKVSETLNDVFEAKRGEWVDALVARVLADGEE